MKGGLIFILGLFSFSLYGQRIQYSHQSVRPGVDDAMKLVADVDGYHHLLFFSDRKEPLIYIFDSNLNLYKKIGLAVSLRKISDVKIVSFRKKYLLYYKTAETSNHHLSIINGDGMIRNISFVLNRASDTLWNRNTFHFFNVNGQLFLLSNWYFDPAKKNISTVIRVDSALTPHVVGHFSVPYDHNKELLRRVFITGNHLFIIKTSTAYEEDNYVDFTSIDLVSGSVYNKNYTVGRYFAAAPSIVFNKDDSIFVTYSTLFTPFGYKEKQPAVFVTKLGLDLREISASNVLKTQFADNVTNNFLTLGKEEIGWVKMTSYYAKSKINTSDVFIDDNYFQPMYFDNGPERIRLTLLDKDMLSHQDTVLKIEEKNFQIKLREYAEFTSNNIPYLAVLKNFSAKRQGLLLINPDHQGNIVVNDLGVFDRYDYFLSLLNSTSDNCVVIPFESKNEYGLVKICFGDR